MKNNFFLIENEILRYILRRTAEKSGWSFSWCFIFYKELVTKYKARVEDFFEFYMHYTNITGDNSFHCLYIYAGKLLNQGLSGDSAAHHLKSYLMLRNVFT